MKGKTIHDMNIGDTASFSKTITDFDVKMFAGITGDFNPVHVNKEHAKDTMFKDRIAHGMLIASLFSTVFGTQIPGEGCIYISQDLKFTKPVYLEDTITATVTVTELDVEKNRVVLETIAINQNGDAVVKGFAKLMPTK